MLIIFVQFDIRKKGGNATTKVFRDKLLEKLTTDVFSEVQVCDVTLDSNDNGAPPSPDKTNNCPRFVKKKLDLKRISDTPTDSFKDIKTEKLKHPDPPKAKKTDIQKYDNEMDQSFYDDVETEDPSEGEDDEDTILDNGEDYDSIDD